MEVIHQRCAGLDISKRDVKACIRAQGAGRRKTSKDVTTWGATTDRVLALREHLATQKVTCVVMEATGDYWKPFYYLLEDGPFEIVLANARQVRNMPGRKTDVNDATWLAELGAHGLVRSSFVPPAPIRRLRDLTRSRTALARQRGQIAQRIEKILEDAGIKLSSVASDILGVSGRAMLDALVAGQRDPGALTDLARGRLRDKSDLLHQALTGRFTDHHATLIRVHLHLIDEFTAAIEDLTAQIEVEIQPFRHIRDLICTIPGIAVTSADVIIAETGGDMTRFLTPGHLASWAGVTPGHNESAGKTKSRHTRPGNRHLKAVLGSAAMSAARTTTYLGARYRRITARSGPMRANVAVQRTILTSIWQMLTRDQTYHDLGQNYFTRINPDRTRNKHVNELRRLGYDVTLKPANVT
jgi:transposase